MPLIHRILVKYEDLLDDIEGEFYKIIKFLSNLLGFKINDDQLKFLQTATKEIRDKKYDEWMASHR